MKGYAENLGNCVYEYMRVGANQRDMYACKKHL